MFFAPPQVKSLSRYSEFGVYLQPKHFLAMLILAILMHATVIGIYSMAPREEVIRIPVRVLNIKLGGGGDSIAQMPTPTTAPMVQSDKANAAASQEAPARPAVRVNQTHANSKNAVSVVDKVLTKPASHHQPLPPRPQEKSQNAATEATLSTPKQYVRAGNLAGKGAGRGKGKSNGRSIAGTPEGDEIIQRYEQTISLWMAQHKTYPEMAKQQGIEGDAIVRIRINREGRILYNSIDRSSGNPMIDDAVLSMVRASDPVPVVPDDYPDGSQLEFLIPVSFRLQ